MIPHGAVEGVDGQLAFDIDAMLREAAVHAAPAWQGAPLQFSTAYHPPGELDAAFARWKFLNPEPGAYARSRMWHRAIAVPGGVEVGEHQFDLFSADLRCEPQDGPHIDCACVGDLTYQAICEPCGWHVIAEGENAVVESWHDHALPDWRQLPIVPARIQLRDQKGRLSKAARSWLAEHYPQEAQFPGAPIITERDTGTRHVPGRSPWGGYDLSATALDPIRAAKPAQQPRRTELEATGLHRPASGSSKPAPTFGSRPDSPITGGLGIGD